MRLMTALGLVVVAVLAQGAAGAGPPFTDASGDTSAADVTLVAVTSDAGGVLTFRTKFKNRVSELPNDRLFLYLNTDRKRSTGDTLSPSDKEGADYYAYLTGTTGRYIVARLRGDKSVLLKKGTSKSRCCPGGVWEFSINRREIGSPKVFDFYVHTKFEDPSKKRFDYAPTKGVYTYRVKGS